MRPFGNWVVIGVVGLIGLFAARDALRAEPAEQRAAAGPEAASLTRSPPQIPRSLHVAAELRAAGISGRLYFTDGRCRLWALRLPSLEWLEGRGTVAPRCRFALSPDGADVLFGRAAWAPDGRLATVEQRTPDGSGTEIRVFARSYGWSAAYFGRSPAFKPDGSLIHVERGTVYEWTSDCPHGRTAVPFGGRNAIRRCRRLALSARVAGPVAEARWLDGRTAAAIARGRLVLVRGDRVRALFGSPSSGLEALKTSPDGRWIAVKLRGQLILLDRELAVDLSHAGVGQIGALDWSPDGHWVVAATHVNVWFFRPRSEEPAIRLPLTAVDVAWR